MPQGKRRIKQELKARRQDRVDHTKIKEGFTPSTQTRPRSDGDKKDPTK
jgi:hypothetical protein